MTLFWVLTGLMALGVSALLVLALLRGWRDTSPAEGFDVQVYRDQLREIERDQGRGVIAEAEAERLRTEVSRRILAADAKAQDGVAEVAQPSAGGRVLAVLMATVVLGGGYGIYAQIGAPGYPDLPLKQRVAEAAIAIESRPRQAEAEAQMPVVTPADVPADYLDLVTKLRAAVAERPNDMQGLILLARSEAALGNFAAAYQAQERIIALKGDQVIAKDHSDLADMMILAAGGYVSPEAQDALEAALTLDPSNGVARYYGGLMMAQTGRPDVAFQMWDRLLKESGPEDAWVPPIREQIVDLAFRAGVSDYQLPDAPRDPALPGPSADDVQNAAQMTVEERMEMIRGMVGRLSDRLATEGGPPEEWARLIGALMVLDEADQARAIWSEAQSVFAEAPQALATVRAAAEQAGILQ